MLLNMYSVIYPVFNTENSLFFVISTTVSHPLSTVINRGLSFGRVSQTGPLLAIIFPQLDNVSLSGKHMSEKESQ